MSAILGNGTVTFGDSTVQSTAATGVGAKAWCRFSSISPYYTPTIISSFNISSITKHTTPPFGYTPWYTVTFTNAMSDANYVVIAQGGSDGVDALVYYGGGTTTSSFGIAWYQQGNDTIEIADGCFVVFN
jgi:hypothetical protein